MGRSGFRSTISRPLHLPLDEGIRVTAANDFPLVTQPAPAAFIYVRPIPGRMFKAEISREHCDQPEIDAAFAYFLEAGGSEAGRRAIEAK
jgi:hypothetical protein